MFRSSLLAPTLREEPSEAEIVSHRLMLRAGLIRKLAGGIYYFLPLATRVIAKIEEIIREEMNRKGAQEVRLPIVQPAELWFETGRWYDYGEEMWRLNDRHGRQFCLGPTHEEVITSLVRSEIHSYRQLPMNLYQIQNKYRDEIRPRFGVMRSREFVMKDGYSFHRDQTSLDQTYDDMMDAYNRIFSRCGLDFRPVEADSGAIGGNRTHEFMALADAGEAEILYCDACGYAGNREKTETYPENPTSVGGCPETERIATPGVHTIQQLEDALQSNAADMAKTLFYMVRVRDAVEDELVAVVLRGDDELNEVKLQHATHAVELRLAEQDEVLRLAGVPVGSAGPVGLNEVRILVDRRVASGQPYLVGANEEGFHLRNACFGRDFDGEVHDLRLVRPGDPCPQCGSPLEMRRGIEVGQVFALGDKYSRALSATFSDEDGTERPMLMGCYGIGVTRTVAAVIEQHHDDDGIIWPVSIAPFHVCIIPVNRNDEQQWETALRIHDELQQRGVDVLLDDRDERPGVKFKDADLIGIPFRITIGPKALAEGKIEWKKRSTQETNLIDLHDIVVFAAEQVQEEIASAGI